MVGDGHLLLPEDFSLLGCWSRVRGGLEVVSPGGPRRA